MKFYFSLLALAAPATAFVSQTNNNAFQTKLASQAFEAGMGVSPAGVPTDSTTSPSTTGPAPGPPRPDGNLSDKVRALDIMSLVKVQGNSLKTWSFQTPQISRVQVMIKTEGRPLNAEIDLWQGPDNIPQRMNVYIEDGAVRPFNAIVETPGGQNTLGIRNTNTMEFPMSALVEAEVDGQINLGARDDITGLASNAVPRTVQGGAVYTKPFEPAVQSIQCLLRTDGRPMYARIELLQGPNNNKQVLDIYCEDGYTRPFFIIMETPETGNVVRIVNTATMEYPFYATVEPYVIDEGNLGEGGPASFFIVD